MLKLHLRHPIFHFKFMKFNGKQIVVAGCYDECEHEDIKIFIDFCIWMYKEHKYKIDEGRKLVNINSGMHATLMKGNLGTKLVQKYEKKFYEDDLKLI